MRLNRFIAAASGLSRRAADIVIAEGRATVNSRVASIGSAVDASDIVTLDSKKITLPEKSTVLLLNKPTGYVSSRNGQGSPTIYDLLPAEYHSLKPVGRLDKDTSGLLLLTNDGRLAHELTHPKFQKEKVYKVELNQPLKPKDHSTIAQGVELNDGPSKLSLKVIDKQWTVIMKEGRNRQIRRTFSALGYEVVRLSRTKFGVYELGSLKPGEMKIL